SRAIEAHQLFLTHSSQTLSLACKSHIDHLTHNLEGNTKFFKRHSRFCNPLTPHNPRDHYIKITFFNWRFWYGEFNWRINHSGWFAIKLRNPLSYFLRVGNPHIHSLSREIVKITHQGPHNPH